MIDAIRMEPLRTWNDPATWADGTVPDAEDYVFIPEGAAICLEGDVHAKSIRVHRELLAGPTAITVTTYGVMVMDAPGKLEVGRHRTPFENEFTLTIIGGASDNLMMGQGTKFLMSMGGGTIELHGTLQISWTKLNATASPGSTSLTLAEPVQWRVGNQVVIASSERDRDQAEVRTITSRQAPYRVTLDALLLYRHHGGAPQVHTRSKDGKTWTLDQRAEIGLLTHNVKVEGDGLLTNDGFDGHIMVMYCAPGYARLSNVELFRIGQKDLLGRYPIHWHMLLNDGAGQFIENSSVHRSFNRAATLHGTEYVRVKKNAAYDHIGLGMFLEDASERFNKINYNLALLTKRPALGEEIIPADNSDDEPQNRTPATYWITHPDNEFIGNLAGGTVGTGFWFAFPRKPTWTSAMTPSLRNWSPTSSRWVSSGETWRTARATRWISMEPAH